MGIIKQALQEIKQDLGLVKKPQRKFIELKSRPREVKTIDVDKEISIKNLRRHPNYFKVRYLIMDCVICNIDCVPPTRELEEVIGIGRSSIARQLLILAQEGLIQRVKLSDSNRGIYYKILVSKDYAIQYRDTFHRSGRKK